MYYYFFKLRIQYMSLRKLSQVIKITVGFKEKKGWGADTTRDHFRPLVMSDFLKILLPLRKTSVG